MMTEAKRAFGAVFKRDGNPVAELTSIGGVEITADTEDVTSHESPGRYREKIQTLLDAGKVPLEGNLYPGDTLGQIGLMTDLASGDLQDFSIELTTLGAAWNFEAIVTKFQTANMPVDGVLTFEAEVEISGQPELALSTSTGLTTPFFSTDVGTIIPAAAGAVYLYVVEIATGETEVVITPTAAAGVITITANGASQVVGTGNPSSPIALGAAGSVTVCTISVKETAKIAKVYTLYLARAAA